jgi:serine/threonine protein kinase/Flp pilus assembly protein TadD
VTDVPQELQHGLADRYRVERELGRGGMATVYLAHDLRHDRPVALKVLYPGLAATLGPERFQREIKLAARLQHPHILPVHDSGETAGRLWFTMPYIDGQSLRHRLKREKQLPLDEAMRIAIEAARALDYAHRHGVIHRDIKPENLLLSSEGDTLLADFGIGYTLGSAVSGERLTETGVVIGTPAYMSPEQAAGERALDARSDIYSLGAVLYEMLAGEPPYTGPTPQAVLAKRFVEPVPRLRAVRDSVPDSVEEAITKALAKVPADRFATAGQFAQALAVPTRAATLPGRIPLAEPSPASAMKSIAVLPFVDMSPHRDQEYFADGVAEEITNALTKIAALRVASRTSSFAFKGRNEDVGEIGRKLKVASLLEGSVRKAGNRLRVTAQLVSAADGYHLWSEHYDREIEDVFAIQDEIAANIVRAMQVVMSEEEKRAIEQPRSWNVQAYESYLRGRQLFHQYRRPSMQLARRMFEQASDIDPSFVLAYAGMANCSSMLYLYWHTGDADLAQADAASRKALELGPGVAEARAARGLALTLSGEYEAAQQEFESAIRIDPRLFEAYYFYARARFQAGDLAKAAMLFEQAAAVRPEDYQSPSLLAMVYEGMERPADAEAAHRRAIRIIENHLDLNPDDARAWCMGGISLTRVGEVRRGLEWAERALALDPDEGAVLYNVACAYAVQGEVGRALDLLEKSVEKGYTKSGEWFEKDPDLASLREVPRFRALLSRL